MKIVIKIDESASCENVLHFLDKLQAILPRDKKVEVAVIRDEMLTLM